MKMRSSGAQFSMVESFVDLSLTQFFFCCRNHSWGLLFCPPFHFEALSVEQVVLSQFILTSFFSRYYSHMEVLSWADLGRCYRVCFQWFEEIWGTRGDVCIQTALFRNALSFFEKKCSTPFAETKRVVAMAVYMDSKQVESKAHLVVLAAPTAPLLATPSHPTTSSIEFFTEFTSVRFPVQTIPIPLFPSRSIPAQSLTSPDTQAHTHTDIHTWRGKISCTSFSYWKNVCTAMRFAYRW